jgi:hypothetical protein
MAKKQKVSVQGTIVTVEYPTIGKRVSIDLAILSAEMQREAALHGLKQKLGDAESGGSPTEKFAMASRIVASLREGQWELTATPVDLTPIIVEAVSRIKKIPQAKILATKPSEDQVKSWGSNAKVKAEILKIRAERAAKAAEEAEDDLEIDLK